METENTICYHSCHGKIVKSVGEVFPHICISIFTQTFVIKSVTSNKKGGSTYVVGEDEEVMDRLIDGKNIDSRAKKLLTPV